MENQTDKIFLKTLQDVVQTLEALENIIATNSERQQEVDYKLSDWLHELQNNENLDDAAMANIAKEIKKLRKERNAVRNESELISEYNKNKQKLFYPEQRQFLISAIQNRNSLLNQDYKNRVITKEEMSYIEMPFEKQVKKTSGHKKITEKHKQIKELYSNGMKAKEISEKLGYPLSTVYSILRNPDSSKEEKYAEVKRLYESGMTQKEIAKKMNCAASSINWIVKNKI